MSLRGTALIRTSRPLGNPEEVGDGVLDFVVDFFSSRRYHLLLDVRLPGREPYAVEGEFRVPLKAEQTGILRTGGDTLPPGLEVPVEVSERDQAKIDIDWTAYVRTPGRRQRQRDARKTHERTTGQRFDG